MLRLLHWWSTNPLLKSLELFGIFIFWSSLKILISNCEKHIFFETCVLFGPRWNIGWANVAGQDRRQPPYRKKTFMTLYHSKLYVVVYEARAKRLLDCMTGDLSENELCQQPLVEAQEYKLSGDCMSVVWLSIKAIIVEHCVCMVLWYPLFKRFALVPWNSRHSKICQNCRWRLCSLPLHDCNHWKCPYVACSGTASHREDAWSAGLSVCGSGRSLHMGNHGRAQATYQAENFWALLSRFHAFKPTIPEHVDFHPRSSHQLKEY